MSAQRSGRRRLQPTPPVQMPSNHQAAEPFASPSVPRGTARGNTRNLPRLTYGTKALEICFWVFLGLFSAAFLYLLIWLVVIVLSIGLEMAGA